MEIQFDYIAVLPLMTNNNEHQRCRLANTSFAITIWLWNYADFLKKIIIGVISPGVGQLVVPVPCKSSGKDKKIWVEFSHNLDWLMVFNATFNNITVLSWRSVLLVEETGVTAENHRPVTSHWQTLSHNVVLSTPYNL